MYFIFPFQTSWLGQIPIIEIPTCSARPDLRTWRWFSVARTQTKYWLNHESLLHCKTRARRRRRQGGAPWKSHYNKVAAMSWRPSLSLAAVATAAAATVAVKDCLKIWFSADLHCWIWAKRFITHLNFWIFWHIVCWLSMEMIHESVPVWLDLIS